MKLLLEYFLKNIISSEQNMKNIMDMKPLKQQQGI